MNVKLPSLNAAIARLVVTGRIDGCNRAFWNAWLQQYHIILIFSLEADAGVSMRCSGLIMYCWVDILWWVEIALVNIAFWLLHLTFLWDNSMIIAWKQTINETLWRIVFLPKLSRQVFYLHARLSSTCAAHSSFYPFSESKAAKRKQWALL